MGLSTSPVRLAPPYTLGRALQYAAFSSVIPVGGTSDVVVDEDYEVVRVRRPVVFQRLAEAVVEVALQYFARRAPSGGCEGATLPFPSLGVEIDCCRLDTGPRLYSFGKKRDADVLLRAGLDDCYTIGEKGAKRVTWTGGAMSYARRLLERGGPLGGRAEDLPTLAKATLFSRYKTPTGYVNAEKIPVDLDTLGTVLLGGVLAFLGRQGATEYYLLPSAPVGGYRLIADLLRIATSPRPYLIARELPVGLEAALSLELSYRILNGEARIDLAGSVISRSRVLVVDAGRRPLVLGSIPLTLLPARVFGASSLDRLLQLAVQSLRAGNGSTGLRDAAAGCLRAAVAFSSNPCGDETLLACIRDLARLYSGSDRLPAQARRLVRGLVPSLSRDMDRALGGCTGCAAGPRCRGT